VVQGLHARFGSERSEVQIFVKQTHVVGFLMNMKLNISVAINNIAITLEIALLALHKNKLVYNLTTFTFLTF
jgi:hypothetical protein